MDSSERRRAVIIGATSGIGRALADILLSHGWLVGLTGRRVELVKDLQESMPDRVFVKYMDVSKTDEAMAAFIELIDEMGGMDLAVVNAGIGYTNQDLEWEKEKETIDVNVLGFAAIANVAIKYFIGNGRGHLVGTSSIASIRGSGDAPAYSASKAFMSNYLEGLRLKEEGMGLPITITDVLPGFVNTRMAQSEYLFWVAPVEKAAEQIYNAIQRKKHRVYITKRWALIGNILKYLPDYVLRRLGV